jgi:ABC-2 type transport system permease protein
VSVTLTIARRELLAFLLTPVGWLVTAMFLFFTSLVYFVASPMLVGGGFSEGQPASLRSFFQIGVWVFIVIGPALSMRTISEELRLGTIESLLTAPVSEAEVIIGKFLGCLGFLLVMLLPTLVYVVALEWYGRPDYGELLTGYAGMILLGAACLATGILASTLTASQMLAYLITIFLWLILLIATMLLPYLATLAGGLAEAEGNSAALVVLLDAGQQAARFLGGGNPLLRVQGFVIGLVDTFNIVYFLVVIVVSLVTAVKALELRKMA